MKQVTWSEFKAFVDASGLSIQYIDLATKYELYAERYPFKLECILDKNLEPDLVTEFETNANYKTFGNRPLKLEIQTVFEMDDKVLKTACSKGFIDSNSEAIVELLVPGTFNGIDPLTSNGRWIDSGVVWFDTKHVDDKVIEVSVVDKDNIFGYGAGVTIKKYSDSEAASNEGWWIPVHTGIAKVEALGGYGFIPSGLYLVIKGVKGDSSTTGAMYANFKWGKSSLVG